MTPLETITQLSHEFGGEEYVRGGGGNTSVKDDSTLWVKPSGTTLLGMQPETFVALDRAKIDELYAAESPEDANAREALVKDLMGKSVRPDSSGRPSVEAPLHNSFRARYVVHTHPALVNGLTCACQGRETAERLFPDALWVPYIDPGYTLCMDVRRMLQDYESERGREPELVLLENHGIFIAGDTPEAIRESYARVMEALRSEYDKAGVAMTLETGPAPAEEKVRAMGEALSGLLSEDAASVVASGSFPVADGPISPDHIVYSKSYPLRGEPTAESVEAFCRKHGYTPRLLAVEGAVYGIGKSDKAASLALEFAQDGSLVMQLAGAFGGVQFMSDRARAFIENWEVEAYRAKVSGS